MTSEIFLRSFLPGHWLFNKTDMVTVDDKSAVTISTQSGTFFEAYFSIDLPRGLCELHASMPDGGVVGWEVHPNMVTGEIWAIPMTDASAPALTWTRV